MKVHTEYLTFNTRQQYEMVHITPIRWRPSFANPALDDGLCFVSPMHITAAIYVNDHESGLIEGHQPVAGKAGAAVAWVQASPDRGRQRGRASEGAAAAPRDHPAGHARQA